MTISSERHRRLRVASVRQVAEGIALARLVSTDDTPLAAWDPGAHLEVQLPSGLIRHYSLCGDPADTSGYDVAVLLDAQGRGGSAEFHQAVRAGTELGVLAPRNDFVLEPADAYLFIAGGVGITPILPMVRHAMSSGASWRLIYAGRSRASMAFLEVVLGLDPLRVTIHAEDENGRPDLSAAMLDVGVGTRVYACGPGPMLDALVAVHAADDVPGPLHLERFAGESSAEVTGAAFEVEARRSGVSVMVWPDDTILATLRPLVTRLPFSCEDGYCGTCETDVLEGVPDHRDTYLDDDERASGDTMMICVSRCIGPRLVLDL